MNRRQIRLLGLYTPIVFRLCILKVIESKFGDPESFFRGKASHDDFTGKYDWLKKWGLPTIIKRMRDDGLC
jgi:hypothetical protein